MSFNTHFINFPLRRLVQTERVVINIVNIRYQIFPFLFILEPFPKLQFLKFRQLQQSICYFRPLYCIFQLDFLNIVGPLNMFEVHRQST